MPAKWGARSITSGRVTRLQRAAVEAGDARVEAQCAYTLWAIASAAKTGDLETLNNEDVVEVCRLVNLMDAWEVRT